jgi:ABC transport system ATP-binding/permease protein
VLDEPTNDLDIETLDLLEELLAAFTGTLIVVSHDRTFLDQVVASTLVFEGSAKVGEYAGGYTDWVRQRGAAASVAVRPVAKPTPAAPTPAARKRKLTLKEAAELAALPDRIDARERERDALLTSLADPATARDGQAMVRVRGQLGAMEADLAAMVARWEALELLAAGAVS